MKRGTRPDHILFFLLLAVVGCATPAKTPATKTAAASYTIAAWSDLAGWPAPGLADTLTAFHNICQRFTGQPEAALPIAAGLVTAEDWQAACYDLQPADRADDSAAEAFIEHAFIPLAVTDSTGAAEGLFTGYYEPMLHGSRTRHGSYQTPLYGHPTDLVSVDLGLFRDDLKGRSVSGRMAGTRLVPYYDRSAIAAGAIADKAPVVAWVDDPIDAFFLEIQGSGRVQLENGTVLRAGYAAGNGRPYTAIGKTLVAMGALQPAEVTAPAIEAWLRAHPDEATQVMNSNANVVFFAETKGDGPVGAAGTILHPGISLAVDRKAIPLGAMVWMDAAPAGGEGDRIQRLMLAEDTGGAINGAVRGDIFFGSGEEARRLAGITRSQGSYWLLVPRPRS